MSSKIIKCVCFKKGKQILQIVKNMQTIPCWIDW